MQNLEQLITLRVNNYSIPITQNEPTTLGGGWVQMANRYEPWWWYLSLTFKYFVSQEYALRQFGRFIRLMNEKVHGKRYRDNGKGIPYLNAIEYQRRGVLHFHALVGGESSMLGTRDMKEYQDIWQHGLKKSNGIYKFHPNGFAKIVKYDSKKGAKHYLAKYVSKGGELDIFIPKYMYPYYGVAGEGENSFEFLNSNL